MIRADARLYQLPATGDARDKSLLLLPAFHRAVSKKLSPNAIESFQAAAATDRKAFNRLRMPLHCANDAV